jgi:pentatricopeptide repeat protein
MKVVGRKDSSRVGLLLQLATHPRKRASLSQCLSSLSLNESARSVTGIKRPARDSSRVEPVLPATVSQRRRASSLTNKFGADGEANSAEPKKQGFLSMEKAREMMKVTEDPDFHKVGSFSPATWRQIVHLLRSWLRFESEESVNASFALLERLLVEQELLLQNQSSIVSGGKSVVLQSMTDEERHALHILSRELLNTDLLNGIINNWRNAWKSQHTKISPRRLLPQLEGYIDRSPSLHPDTKTYNMIMDAVTKRFSHQVAQKLAEEIYQRMSNRAPQPTKQGHNGLSFQWSPAPTINGKLRCINDISPDHFTYTTLINVYTYSKNPRAAEEVLGQLHRAYLEGISPVQPNVHTFTACINAWAGSDAPDAPEKAESLLQVMQLMDQEGQLDDIRPSVWTINALLKCWAKSGRPDAGKKAEAIFSHMEDKYHVQPDLVSLNTVLYTLTIVAYDLELAESILQRMTYPKPDRDSYQFIMRALHEHANERNDISAKVEFYLGRMIRFRLKPKLTTYNHALGALAHCNANDAGIRALKIFQRMSYPPPHYNVEPTKPNTLSYEYLIMALANNGKAELAEEKFWDLVEENLSGNKFVTPNQKILNMVVSAWSDATRISDREKVTAIMNLLQRVARLSHQAVKPDKVTCNILLFCLSKLKNEKARFQAEEVLAELEKEWRTTNDDYFKPDIISYASVMRAHANVGDLQKTREIFNRALQAYRNGNKTAKPDVVAFNHMLLAIARGARGRNRGAGKLAEDLFQQMSDYHAAGLLDELPNKKSYDIKINCWANSGIESAGVEADKILQTMAEKAANGFPELEPDVVSYTTAINAHAKSGNHLRAEELFNKMLVDFGHGNEKLKPNMYTINALLAAIANSKEPDAGEKAEAYLRDIISAREVLSIIPDAVTFSTVITAWINSGDSRAGERAKSLFREIESMSQKYGFTISLDAGFYKSMLRACALTGDTTTAESLLDALVRSDEIKPDRYMFHALLHAYAKTQNADNADKADALLEEMKSLAASTKNGLVLPDMECYHCVLECWAKSERKEKAVERSEAILLEMERIARVDPRAKPTHVTYSR